MANDGECEDDILERNIGQLDRATPRSSMSETEDSDVFHSKRNVQFPISPTLKHKTLNSAGDDASRFRPVTEKNPPFVAPPTSHWNMHPGGSEMLSSVSKTMPVSSHYQIRTQGTDSQIARVTQSQNHTGSPSLRRNVINGQPVMSPHMIPKNPIGSDGIPRDFQRPIPTSQTVFNNYASKPAVVNNQAPLNHSIPYTQPRDKYNSHHSNGVGDTCHCQRCDSHTTDMAASHDPIVIRRQKQTQDDILLKSRELDLCWQEDEYDFVKDFTGMDRTREAYATDRKGFMPPPSHHMPPPSRHVPPKWQHREQDSVKDYTSSSYGQELGSRIPSSERISLTPPFVESGCVTPAGEMEPNNVSQGAKNIESNDRKQPQALHPTNNRAFGQLQNASRPLQEVVRRKPQVPREDYGNADSVKDYSAELRQQQELSSRIPSCEILYFTPPWISENNSGVHTPCVPDNIENDVDNCVSSQAPELNGPCMSCHHPAWDSAAGKGDPNAIHNELNPAPDSIKNFSANGIEKTSRIPSNEQLCFTPPWIECEDPEAEFQALTLEERRVIDEETRKVGINEKEQQAKKLREENANNMRQQVQDPTAVVTGPPGRDSGFCSEDPQQQQQQQQMQQIQENQQLQQPQQSITLPREPSIEETSQITSSGISTIPQCSNQSNTIMQQQQPRPLRSVTRKHSWSSRDSGASNHTDISTVVNLPTSMPITAPGSPEPNSSSDNGSIVTSEGGDSHPSVNIKGGMKDAREPIRYDRHDDRQHYQHGYGYNNDEGYYPNHTQVPRNYHGAMHHSNPTQANQAIPPNQYSHGHPGISHDEMRHYNNMPIKQKSGPYHQGGGYDMSRQITQPQLSPTLQHRMARSANYSHDQLERYPEHMGDVNSARTKPVPIPNNDQHVQCKGMEPSMFDESISRSSLLPHRESPPLADNLDSASVVSFASSSYQNIDSKMDMVSSLLSMLGTHDKDDMASTMLAMSSSPDSCTAMRQSGCIALLVDLIHDASYEEKGVNWIARRRAEEALENIIITSATDRRSRRESRILRLLQVVRAHCEAVLIGGAENYRPRRGAPPLRQNGPASAVLALMKMTVEKEHKTTICELGGLQALCELLAVDGKANGRCLDKYSVALRKSASMALIELTLSDNQNKVSLCSMKSSLIAIVMQLQYTDEQELVQFAANILRNISWKVDDYCKERLMEVNSVRALMESVQQLTSEAAIRNTLCAVWNLSAHSQGNKSQVCSTPGSLEYLCYALSYRSQTGTLAVAESAGGILRNVSSLISKRADYRDILRSQGCLQTLISHLRSPSTRIVSNACGVLWNLSAHSAKDQEVLWELGAVSVLKTLVNSKHKLISSSSASALRNLLRVKPGSSGTDTESLLSYKRRQATTSSNSLQINPGERSRGINGPVQRGNDRMNAFLVGANASRQSNLQRSDSQQSSSKQYNHLYMGVAPTSQTDNAVNPRKVHHQNKSSIPSHGVSNHYGGSVPLVTELGKQDKFWRPMAPAEIKYQPALPRMQPADSLSSSSSLAASTGQPSRNNSRRQSLPKEQIRRHGPKNHGLFKHRRSVSDSFQDFNPADLDFAPVPAHAETDSELYNQGVRASMPIKKAPQKKTIARTIKPKNFQTPRMDNIVYHDGVLSLARDSVTRSSHVQNTTDKTITTSVIPCFTPPKVTAEETRQDIRQAIQRRSNDAIVSSCASNLNEVSQPLDNNDYKEYPPILSSSSAVVAAHKSNEKGKKSGVFKGRRFPFGKKSNAKATKELNKTSVSTDHIEMISDSNAEFSENESSKKPLRSNLKQNSSMKIFKKINVKSKKNENTDAEDLNKKSVVVTSL